MLKAGKKTREWERTRRLLKPRFEAAGITTCELRYDGCWYSNGLSFCHVDKRRYLKPGELTKVVLGCANCHPILELMRRDKMRATVEAVIAKRICQP